MKEEKDGEAVAEAKGPSVRRSISAVNPSWWTIKRWSEFMWLSRRVMIAVKSMWENVVAPSGCRPAGR